MSTVLFKQGEDQKIILEFNENNTPIDLSSATNIKAILKVGGVEQVKYALVTEAGFGVLELDSQAVGKNVLWIFVERGESINFPIGPITLIVLVSFPDIEFPDEAKVREFKFQAGRILKGEGIDIDI